MERLIVESNGVDAAVTGTRCPKAPHTSLSWLGCVFDITSRLLLVSHLSINFLVGAKYKWCNKTSCGGEVEAVIFGINCTGPHIL